MKGRNGEAETAAERPRTAAAWLFAGAAAAYFVLFFLALMPSLPPKSPSGEPFRRADFLPFVVLPDVIVSQWFGNPPSFAVFDRLPLVLAACGVLSVAVLLGYIALRACGADGELTFGERLFFSSGVGLSLVSLYTLIVGLAGGLDNAWLFAVPAACIVAAAVWRWRRQATSKGSRGTAPATARLGDWLVRWVPQRSDAWLLLAAPFVALTFLGAALPPVDFDVREYHLEAPKEFFQQGRIGFVPFNAYENMPLGAEMLALVSMVAARDWWTGALAGKMVMAAFAPLTALGLLTAARRFLSPSAGYAAAVVYLSTPWVVRVSASGLVDCVLAYYLFAAVYAALLWREAVERDAPLATRRLILAGLLAGGAAATKYTGVMYVAAPLAAWVAFASWRTAPRRKIVSAALAVMVLLIAAAISGGLWYARNLALTGNPTYPVFSNVFGNPAWSSDQITRWNAAHRPPGFSIVAFASSAADLAWRSEWTSPALAPLVAAGIWLGWRRAVVRSVLLMALYVLAAWWLATHRIDRFWIPALPLAAFVAAAAFAECASKAWRIATIATLAAACAANLLMLAPQTPGFYIKYFVPLARLRVDPDRVDPWHLYLNRHVREGQAVLAVGDAEVFDLEAPVYYSTAFDTPPIELWAAGRTQEEFAAELARRRVSHVYVHWGEIERYRSPGNYGYSDFVTRERFAEWVAVGVLEPPLPMIDNHAGMVYPVRRAQVSSRDTAHRGQTAQRAHLAPSTDIVRHTAMP